MSRLDQLIHRLERATGRAVASDDGAAATLRRLVTEYRGEWAGASGFRGVVAGWHGEPGESAPFQEILDVLGPYALALQADHAAAVDRVGTLLWDLLGPPDAHVARFMVDAAGALLRNRQVQAAREAYPTPADLTAVSPGEAAVKATTQAVRMAVDRVQAERSRTAPPGSGYPAALQEAQRLVGEWTPGTVLGAAPQPSAGCGTGGRWYRPRAGPSHPAQHHGRHPTKVSR